MIGNKEDPRRNSEGYPDPTAYIGTKSIVKEENDAEKRASELIKVLKFIINAAGFELTERIRIRDRKTGREFR